MVGGEKANLVAILREKIGKVELTIYQCFSLSIYYISLENHITNSDSAGLRQSPRVCLSNKVSDETCPTGANTHFEWLKAQFRPHFCNMLEQVGIVCHSTGIRGAERVDISIPG